MRLLSTIPFQIHQAKDQSGRLHWLDVQRHRFSCQMKAMLKVLRRSAELHDLARD